MANIVTVAVVEIDGNAVVGGSINIGFPTQGCLLGDSSASPTRNVTPTTFAYSSILYQNHIYYSQTTFANLVTAFNA